MTFVLVPAGTFSMGGESSFDAEQPVHRVTIRRAFYLGIHEVTQDQYERVMGTNPSQSKGPDLPVESVRWGDAAEFCHKLSRREGIAYRLPTEAEWEYACRAGAPTAYCFGGDAARLGQYAWFAANSPEAPQPVGQKKPNAWGLFDMHGNVWEWCHDYYADYPHAAQSDPKGPASGKRRILRGGSWLVEAPYCRSAFRFLATPAARVCDIGFRVCRPGP